MLEELSRGRQERAFHALALQAQHDDDIATRQALPHVVEYVHAERLYRRRQQCLRADHAHFGRAERGEPVDQRPGHARVQDIADDRHRELAEVALVVTNGE